MRKYVCSICGFIYDEGSGYPEGDIPPETAWADVPSTFVCPLCGALKAEFNEQAAERPKSAVSSNSNNYSSLPDEISYTAIELSSIFSNLAKGCEKQYDPETAELYLQLSSYYAVKSQTERKPDIENLKALLQTDLSSNFAYVNEIAGKNHDRGSLRALKWSEQVSRIINSHLNKVTSNSADFIENTNVFVCDICGFIFIGDKKPEICPVCKVPNMKMTQVQRGA